MEFVLGTSSHEIHESYFQNQMRQGKKDGCKTEDSSPIQLIMHLGSVKLTSLFKLPSDVLDLRTAFWCPQLVLEMNFCFGPARTQPRANILIVAVSVPLHLLRECSMILPHTSWTRL